MTSLPPETRAWLRDTPQIRDAKAWVDVLLSPGFRATRNEHLVASAFRTLLDALDQTEAEKAKLRRVVEINAPLIEKATHLQSCPDCQCKGVCRAIDALVDIINERDVALASLDEPGPEGRETK